MVRGDVHPIRLPASRGRVQSGRRYAVIVQADNLARLSTVIVCPTSRSASPAAFRPEVQLPDGETRVLCEMVSAVDIQTLGERVGHLSFDDLASVDEVLGKVLGVV